LNGRSSGSARAKKSKGTLEQKARAIAGNAEPIEKALEEVELQDRLEVAALLLREVEQPLAD
jgi:hypothetical protein